MDQLDSMCTATPWSCSFGFSLNRVTGSRDEIPTSILTSPQRYKLYFKAQILETRISHLKVQGLKTGAFKGLKTGACKLRVS
jgi:hypothetical protein